MRSDLLAESCFFGDAAHRLQLFILEQSSEGAFHGRCPRTTGCNCRPAVTSPLVDRYIRSFWQHQQAAHCPTLDRSKSKLYVVEITAVSRPKRGMKSFARVDAKMGKHSRTSKRVPSVLAVGDNGPFCLRISYAARSGASLTQVRSDKTGGFHPAWSTRAAAEAAKMDFKTWVEEGMHAQQRAAQASSTTTHTDSVAPFASRFSSRINLSGRAVLRLCVATLAGGCRVSAHASTTTAPMNHATLEGNWRIRSAKLSMMWRARRTGTVEAARAAIPEGTWEHFLERCRAVATAMINGTTDERWRKPELQAACKVSTVSKSVSQSVSR